MVIFVSESIPDRLILLTHCQVPAKENGKKTPDQARLQSQYLIFMLKVLGINFDEFGVCRE